MLVLTHINAGSLFPVEQSVFALADAGYNLAGVIVSLWDTVTMLTRFGVGGLTCSSDPIRGSEAVVFESAVAGRVA
jgi:hypothetical protein